MAAAGVEPLLIAHGLKMVVGLGNPGRKYEGTRHNLGFALLDRLASIWQVGFANEMRWQAQVAGGPGVLLLKPQTFMNASGRAVASAMRYLGVLPEELLVVFDDISLPCGTMRFRMKGSSGGHNGIKSIINDLGSEHFPRLKLGVGNSKSNGLVDHVLSKFSEEEALLIEKVLATGVEALQVAVTEGVEPAANKFNNYQA